MLFILYALRPIYQSLTIIPISSSFIHKAYDHGISLIITYPYAYDNISLIIAHPYAYDGISLITTFGQPKPTADKSSDGKL